MKKYSWFLFLLIFLFSGCKDNYQYTNDKSNLKIMDFSLDNYPDIELDFISLINGTNPERINNKFKSEIIIDSDELTLIDYVVRNLQNQDIKTTVFLDIVKTKRIFAGLFDNSDIETYSNDTNGFTKLKNYNKILLKKIRNSIDSNYFLFYLEEYLKDLNENQTEFIVVYITDYKHDNKLSKSTLQDIHNLLAVNTSIFFGIFYEVKDYKDLEVDFSALENCMFIKPLKETKNEEQTEMINKSLNILHNSFFSADIKLEKLNDPGLSKAEITIVYRELSDNIIIPVIIEPSLKKDTDKNQITQAIIVEKSIEENLQDLKSEYQAYGNPEIREEVYKLIKSYLNETCNSEKNDSRFSEMLSIMSEFEGFWYEDTMEWYIFSKLDLLIDYYFYYIQSENLDQSDIIEKQIVELSRSNFSLINQQSTMKQRFNSFLYSLIETSFVNKNYGKVAELFSFFGDNVTSYRLRYYHAKSEEFIFDYTQCIKAYIWLQKHWQEEYSDLIKQDDIIKKLVDLYMFNSDFSQAYDLIKAHSMSEKNVEFDFDIATTALTLMRAQFIKPILEAAHTFFNTEHKVRTEYLEQEFKKIEFPHYIDAIYFILSGVTDLMMIRDKDVQIIKPVNYHSRFCLTDSTSWMIRRSGGGYFVIQLENNRLSSQEQVLINNLNRNFIDRQWAVFEYSIKDNEKRFPIEILTLFMQYKLTDNNTTIYDTYKSYYHLIPDFSYLSVQDNSGEIIYSDKYNNAIADYRNDGWVISTHSALYYEQTLESGGEKFLDIVYPLINDNGWFGVVRYGFTK